MKKKNKKKKVDFEKYLFPATNYVYIKTYQIK